VWWPVTVNVPTDGGKTVKATFNAQFEVLPAKEADEILYGKSEDHTDLLARVIVGLKGVGSEAGEELPFEEAKAQLLSITYARTALFEAYGECANGRGRAKN